MNILQVTHSFHPCYQAGGVVKVAYEISRALVKRGHKVTVITTDGCKPRLVVKKNSDVDIEGISVWYFQNISNYMRIKFKIATPYFLPVFLKKQIKNFDIIHIHEHRTLLAIVAHHYAKKYDIPYIIQAHGSVLPFFEYQNLKKLYDFIWGDKILRDASKFIAVSKVERDQYVKMGMPEDKIEIIPNGIDISEYKTLPEQGKFRKKYGIRSDEKVILYLGRVHKRKGIDFLINGFSRVLNKYQDVRLVIAGPDGGFLDILTKQIETLKIKEKVIIAGPLSKEEKIEAYVDADVVVYPGIGEIFGLVPFEAIMCGTPVIVTDDCGCGEIIKEGQCGSIITYGDIAGLSTKITEIFTNPPDAEEKVKQGKQYIKEWLLWETNISKFEDLYANCLHTS